jgi:hypothetical protein
MTDDLIKRLRGILSSPRNAWDTFSDTRQVPVAVLTEAADALEAQAERIAELEWQRDNNIRGCQCSEDEACAHVRRAEKAEADLAAAQATALFTAKEKAHVYERTLTALVAAREALKAAMGWVPLGVGFHIGHADAIAAARGEREKTVQVKRICETCRWNDSRTVCRDRACGGRIGGYREWEGSND